MPRRSRRLAIKSLTLREVAERYPEILTAILLSATTHDNLLAFGALLPAPPPPLRPRPMPLQPPTRHDPTAAAD